MAEPAQAWFTVPAEHPVLCGHFPGRPIVPAVMLLEWLLQEAARQLGRAPATLRIRTAKFFTPLAPAQRAELWILDAGERRCDFSIRHDSVQIASGIIDWGGDD